jgi:hypothetical protein
MINGIWSPLYPAMLGIALRFLKPAPYWESAVAALVNFIIYVFALISFEFLLRELINLSASEERQPTRHGYLTLPPSVWIVLGHALFIWSSLVMIGTAWSSVMLRAPGLTPDMLVAVLIYLAAGMLLRIRRGLFGFFSFAVLGVILGVSYLAKAVMFPISFVFLGVSLFLTGNLRAALPRVAMASVIFLALASVYIVPLSLRKERLTFGDTGAFSYAHFINGTPHFHWQGEPPGNGTPKHPTRKIFDDPDIYEFGLPVGGSYPPWYDPSYWYEGLAPHFDLKPQLRALGINTLFHYYRILFSEYNACLLLAFLILAWLAGRQWRLSLRGILGYWYLLVPALAALCLYWFVYVEARHVGPFLVLLWLGLFSGLRIPESEHTKRLVRIVPIATVVTMGTILAVPAIHHAYLICRELARGVNPSASVDWQVADGLHRIGIKPGDKVASLGLGSQWDFYWARLAKIQIVVEAPDSDSFWSADESMQTLAIKAFAGTGAKAVVAKKSSGVFSSTCCFASDGWQRIGNTDYYAFLL